MYIKEAPRNFMFCACKVTSTDHSKPSNARGRMEDGKSVQNEILFDCKEHLYEIPTF